MLTIIVPASPGNEMWDEEKQEFIYNDATKEQTLELEHSLISLSKWESKWCKPFLAKTELTQDEILDYVRCMTLTRTVDPNVYSSLSSENMLEIKKYIESPMTATTIIERNPGKKSSEQFTSELLYYYMFASGIPIECEKWHLNRLITLIKIFGVKNQPLKKMTRSEIMSQNAALNSARRKQMNSRG